MFEHLVSLSSRNNPMSICYTVFRNLIYSFICIFILKAKIQLLLFLGLPMTHPEAFFEYTIRYYSSLCWTVCQFCVGYTWVYDGNMFHKSCYMFTIRKFYMAKSLTFNCWCFLCSLVKKILVYKICESFTLILFTFYAVPNSFELGVV